MELRGLGWRLLKWVDSGRRTRYFFNGLTEEIRKVSVGTHSETAFANLMASWQSGLWTDTYSSRAGWHHNTKELDGDTGFVYMHQRWYIPETGTFASKAPYPPMMEHGYGFAMQLPSSAIDPYGRSVEVCCRPVDDSGAIARLGRALGARHCWLRAGGVVAGMGGAAGPGSSGSGSGMLGGDTTITEQSAEQGSCKCMEGCDENCVKLRLQLWIGGDPGDWFPWNNCQTWVRNVLKECGCYQKGSWEYRGGPYEGYEWSAEGDYDNWPVPQPPMVGAR